MTRKAKSLGAALAALTAGAWGCGGTTANSANHLGCGGADAACEVNTLPGCAGDASCVSSTSCTDGGCADGASVDASHLSIVDSAPPECAGDASCASCVAGQECLPTNPCHRGVSACVGGVYYCVDMLTNVAPGTACGGGSVCDDGACLPSGNPFCPGPGCDSGTTCTGAGCDAGMTCASAGASCPLPGICYYGVIKCFSGEALCETGMPLPNGSSCGSPGSICVNGNCSSQFYVTPVSPITSSSSDIDAVLFDVTDVMTTDSASAITATLNWGDGSSSPGTVAGSAGTFTVSGSHSYAIFGVNTITLVLTDTITGASTTQTLMVTMGVTQFNVYEAGRSITSGPDGNLWFTLPYAGGIGQMTTAGVLTTYPIPTTGASPAEITVGPDKNLWFTEQSGNKIGSITTLGVIKEFSVPTLGAQPSGITAGPDGNVWFTETAGDKIGRVTPTGVVTEFPLLIAQAGPAEITGGPDGNVWFTLQYGQYIGVITPAGVISTIPLPGMAMPFGITTGTDGNIWFADEADTSLGKVTPSGVVTGVMAGMSSANLITDSAGNFWFTRGDYGDVTNFGKLTPAGVTTLYQLPLVPSGLTLGPDGNIWLASNGAIAMVKP